MSNNSSTYVAAFQTWNGGISRMVTGEANVQLFMENAKDSFAKLHLFIDEKTANECHEKEWNALYNIKNQPEEEYDVPEDWNSEPTDNGWYRGVDGGLYEDYEQSIGE